MKHYFSVSDVIDRAWDLTKEYGFVLVIVYIVIKVIGELLGSSMSPEVDPQAIIDAMNNTDFETFKQIYFSNPLGTIVMMLFDAVMMLGFVNCMLLLAKGVIESVSLEAWKQPAKVYLNYVVLEIIVKIIAGVGYCLCILPGLYLDARLQFAPLRALDHPEEGIMDCLSASWNMTSDNVMNLIWLLLVEFFIIIVGLIICCVGVIPAAVICHFAEVEAYLVLSGFYDKEPEQSSEIAY